MGLSREEQLLNELLRDVRDADQCLDAAELEARAVAAFVGRLGEGGTPDTTYYLTVAAAAVFAVVLLASRGPELGPLPVVQAPVHLTGSVNQPVQVPDTVLNADSVVSISTSGQSSVAESPVEFVPLVPLAEHELTGSFQIVRVQMPRASLGALTSPFEHPADVVEADVLLGEDGMARAIRVSASESIYPRRSR